MKTWLVNSNSNRDPAHIFMLRQNKAAAFYECADKVDQISKGDLVLLYHNNNRIIAVGCVVAPPNKGHEIFGTAMNSEEHSVDVNWLWKTTLDPKTGEPTSSPINRHDIGKVSGGIDMVRKTVVDVTEKVDYQKLLSEIARVQNF
jgi:predicted Mrr-cat superfamily restriction endonuclease